MTKLASDKYKELVHAQKECADFLVVNWRFHTICNFTCSYCPSFLNDGAHQGIDLELVLRASDRIISQSSKKNFFFEFTGGEITYYRKFTELMTELKKRNVHTGIISNGSRTLEWWKEHSLLLNHICLSFHPEQCDKDHFYKVVVLLNKTMKVHVNIMMLPDRFDELYDFASALASSVEGISLSMQPLIVEMKSELFPYTTAQQQVLNEQSLPWEEHIVHFSPKNKKTTVYRGPMLKRSAGEKDQITDSTELIARQENNWRGWNCWAGLENIAIDETGKMFRGWCRQSGAFGNITEDFQLPDQPVFCLSDHCSCGLDIMCTKKKNY